MSFLIMERIRLCKAKALFFYEMPEDACVVYLGVAERLSGRICLEYGAALGGAGLALFQIGEHGRAKEYCQCAASIFEQLPPSERRDLHLALLYNDIGVVFQDELEYSQRLEYSDRALKLLEGLKPSVAAKHLSSIYNTKMVCCADNNDLEGFIEFLPKAVKYKEYADRLTYHDMNRLLQKNLDSVMKRSITRPDEILWLLNILLTMPELDGAMRNIILESGSLFFTRVGDFDRALEYAHEWLDGSIHTYSEKSRQTAEAYIQTAFCYYNIAPDSKYWDEAGESALFCSYKALEILQDYFSEDTEMIADACYWLAMVLIGDGQYDEALRYIRQSIDKIRLTRENEHFLVYSKLAMFTSVYMEQGKFAKALEYAIHVLEAAKKDKDADCLKWLEYYKTTIALAVVCEDDHAVEYAGELKELWPRILEAVFDIPEDDLRLSCVRLIKETVSLFFSMEFTYRNPFCTEELYGFILKTNHIDTELNYIYAQHFQTLQNPELKIIRQKISELEKKAEWLTVEGKRGTQEYEETDRQLEAARVEVLKALSGSKAGSVFEHMKLEDIQQTLEENEVILEYVRYSQIKSKQRTTMDFVDCYCGFVITKASITLYFLDTCEKIDTMINDFITKMETGQDVDGLLEAIAEILLGQLRVCSGNTSTVYIVPDSVLYKLPFELLTDRIWPVEDSVPRSVIYLSSGRDLLRNTRVPEKYKILILANPQYNLDEESEGHDGTVNNSGIRRFGNEKIAPDPDTLPPLQFSEAEAQRIAKVFGENSATVLTGENASATALLAEADTDILHISTHGFACQSENHHSSSVVHIMPERIHYFENCEDPLLRCGLYFAGASNWLRGGELPDIYGDGVLLGHDLAAMELSQYRLAVLSACQTAEGDVHTGEGLKGLRHAFELAGVGCLICTLWKVDDLASALLMDQFYQELLTTGTLPSEALARAKQYVRTITAGELVRAGWDEYLNDDVIDHLMREGLTDYANYLQDILDIPDMQPFAHPRYWAGFIIQGHCIRQM